MFRTNLRYATVAVAAIVDTHTRDLMPNKPEGSCKLYLNAVKLCVYPGKQQRCQNEDQEIATLQRHSEHKEARQAGILETM